MLIGEGRIKKGYIITIVKKSASIHEEDYALFIKPLPRGLHGKAVDFCFSSFPVFSFSPPPAPSSFTDR